MTREHDEFERLGYCQRTLEEAVQQWEESVAVLDLSRCPFPALREDWEHILGGTDD